MKIDPYILFFGNSVDASIQMEFLKEYILHMEDSLAEKIESCESKHEELSLEMKCSALQKTSRISCRFISQDCYSLVSLYP